MTRPLKTRPDPNALVMRDARGRRKDVVHIGGDSCARRPTSLARSFSDLMRATGLEKGGIYRHFASKEELAAEAFDYAWRETLEARIHDLDSIANSVDRLKQLVVNFVERRGIIPGGCPLLNTAIDTDDGNSVLRERARSALGGWRDYVVSIIRTGIRAREIRPRTDAKKLATLIISSLEGAIMVYRLERDEEPLRAVRAHLDNYLETEVRARSK